MPGVTFDPANQDSHFVGRLTGVSPPDPALNPF